MLNSVLSWPGWEAVETILAFFGLAGIILSALRLFFALKKQTWRTDVRITDYPSDYNAEDNEINAVYSRTCYHFSPYSNLIIFKPIDCIIPRLELRDVSIVGKPGKVIEVFKNVAPRDSICFMIERAETIPSRMLRWYSEYGEYGEHYFCENRRNGINGLEGYRYQKTLLSIVRKMLEIK